MDRGNIRDIRRRLSLSQERFARLLGVSSQTVRRWEMGLTRPLPIIAVRLEELQQELRGPSRRGGTEMREDASQQRENTGVDIGLSLGGLFKGVGSILDVVAKMVEEGKEEAGRTGTVEAMGGKVKGVYGFSVRLGMEGKPVIERFGNIRETSAGATVAETREPIVDVMDEPESIVVVAEMPGVEERDIRVAVDGNVLEIAASSRGRSYQKEVPLPSLVDATKVEKSYRNGILEVHLSKTQQGKA